MPHIVILDEFGNEIGREDHDPETLQNADAELAGDIEPDHEPRIVRVNLGRVAELLKEAKKDKEPDPRAVKMG